MLLPWLSPPFTGTAIPDAETRYHAYETENTRQDYRVIIQDRHSSYVLSEHEPEIGYRVMPTKR